MSIREIIYFIVRIARPRFALYIVGVYIVGFAYAGPSYDAFLSPDFWLHVLFFLIPGNLFLYGVNDYFDADTDQYNEKKQEKEAFVEEKSFERSLLFWVLVVSFSTGIIFMAFQKDLISTFILALFLAISFFYSAPPTRFKAHPFIDFASNILYIIPGILGFYHVSGQIPDTQSLLALACWTSAMHLFSAIPDIDSDSKAGLQTTAVVLGVKKSLLLCTLLWSLFALLISFSLSSYFPWILIAWLYPLFSFYVFINMKKLSLAKVYWIYPYLNVAIGALAFFIVLFL